MLAGALVFANSSGASMQAATNVSGGFMFHLPNGMYQMSATAFGYARAPTANVTVAGAPVVGLTLTLSTLNYTVLGVVTNASSGSPIANATVVVALAGPPLLARTSSTGQFVLNLAAGRYGVQVSAFVYQSINGTLVVGPNNLSASYALVPAPEFILNGTITVPDVNGSTRGTTLLMATPNGTLEFDVTNSSFTLHVPNGTYQLVALTPDFAPVVLTVVVEGTHVETVPIVFSSIIPVPPRPEARSPALPYFQVGAAALEVSAAIAWLLFGPVPWRRHPPGNDRQASGLSLAFPNFPLPRTPDVVSASPDARRGERWSIWRSALHRLRRPDYSQGSACPPVSRATVGLCRIVLPRFLEGQLEPAPWGTCVPGSTVSHASRGEEHARGPGSWGPQHLPGTRVRHARRHRRYLPADRNPR